MRRSILVLSLFVGCAPAQKATAPAATPNAAATSAAEAGAASTSAVPVATQAPTIIPSGKQCGFSVRRISAYGRGAMRPQIAATADAFAVAWEETTDHRSIRVATFALDAHPLGGSIEVADVAHAAAEPRVAANAEGDGFAVFWSASVGDGSSAIDLRRIDRFGKPKSDAIPVVVAPGARALDATAVAGGWALAWWNWSGTPHELAVSFLDKDGRAVGKSLPVTRAPSPDPTVRIAAGAALGRRAAAVLAWDETVDGVDHVVLGDLGQERLEGRVDLGPGVTPRLGAGVVVFERPAETAIMVAPVAGGAPVRLVDGHVPAATPKKNGVTALCYLRDTDPSAEGHVDELICGDLVDGKLVDPTRIAVEPRGIFGLHVATANGRIGVTWQSDSEDDTGVSFASLSCPEVAAAAKARE
ncbi:MAG TPA: hypothetical protein VF334_11665 [Polyangia bacterium]